MTTSKSQNINTQQLIFQLNRSEKELYQRNPGIFASEESGYGPGFLRPNVNDSNIPQINVILLDEHGQYVFHWKGFTDIRLVQDSNYPELQVSSFLGTLPDINSEDKTYSHDNYQKVYQQAMKDKKYQKILDEMDEKTNLKLYTQYREILKILKLYGWKTYIPLVGNNLDPSGYPNTRGGYPRILGEDSWRLYKEELGNYSNLPDGYFIDSYEKWNKYVQSRNIKNSINTMFYKDNLILDLYLTDTYTNINIETNTASYLYRYDEKTRGEKWREYLAADIPKWQAKRKQAEDELKAKGYHIDETYVDAPLPK